MPWPDGDAQAGRDAPEDATGHRRARGFRHRRRVRIPGLGVVRPAPNPRRGLRLRPLESGKRRPFPSSLEATGTVLDATSLSAGRLLLVYNGTASNGTIHYEIVTANG